MGRPPFNYFLQMVRDSGRIIGGLQRTGSKYNLRLDKETGDLLFQFADGIHVQVFNFTGYEVWEIHFPDGTGEYSNYVYRLPAANSF